MNISASVSLRHDDRLGVRRAAPHLKDDLPRMVLHADNIFISLAWEAAEALIKELTSEMNTVQRQRKPNDPR